MNNTLIKGLQLLELLVRGTSPLGLSELGTELGIGKSNVHRLLQGLVELGYVSKDEGKGIYRATLKLWELGQAMDVAIPIKSAAADAMARLLDRTRETVHLSVLDANEVVYLAKLDSPEPVRAYSEVGGRAPAHCVATGKALLAWLSGDAVASLSRRLKQYSPNTITDPDEFLQEMERVRGNGYAVNRGEWRNAVWGVAAPVLTRKGIAVAAIGVSGPAHRVKPQIRLFAEEVLNAIKSIRTQSDTFGGN